MFVRDNAAPTASVMVKLARGRQLADSQVTAIVNLVASSVPSLTVDAVKVIDQHGRLLSSAKPGDTDRLDMQSRLEEKLRSQVSALLTPMLGEGNFSSEIQVDLDMDQLTSARESYDKQGVVRSETQSASQTAGGAGAAGVPGVLSNTPPPPTTAQPRCAGCRRYSCSRRRTRCPRSHNPAPRLHQPMARPRRPAPMSLAAKSPSPTRLRARSSASRSRSRSARRSWSRPSLPRSIRSSSSSLPPSAQIPRAAIRSRSWCARSTPSLSPPPAFWETPWFAMIVRNVVALLAVLLTLLLGVRPLIKALKREPAAAIAKDSDEAAAKGEDEEDTDENEDDAESETENASGTRRRRKKIPRIEPIIDPETGEIDPEALSRQVGLAQRIVVEQPDNAINALRQLLKEPTAEPTE